MTTTNNNPPLDPVALRKLAQEALELAEEAIMGPWDLVEEPLEVNELGQERGIKPSRFLTIRTHWQHAQLKAPAPIIWQMFSPYYTQKHYATIHHEETGRFMAASRQLVPNLATALLAALDRVRELEKEIADQNSPPPPPIKRHIEFCFQQKADNLGHIYYCCDFCRITYTGIERMKKHLLEMHGDRIEV